VPETSWVFGPADVGAQFRAVFHNTMGETRTGRITMREAPSLGIDHQPLSVTAKVGTTVTFSVGAARPDLSYRWETSPPGGASFAVVPIGAYVPTTDWKVGAADDGRRFRLRVVVSFQQGTTTGYEQMYSDVVALSLAPPSWPFANHPALVDRVATDLTGAPLAAADAAAWASKLDAGTATRGDLEDALRRSPDNVACVDPTTRLYRAFLGRAPDPSGLEFWIRRKRAGTSTVTRMADQFASSSEFRSKYGTLSNQAFVTRIYTDVLGRTADPSGIAYWTKKLDTKAKTRGGVMVGFSESNEYKRKQAENTDLAIAYISLLGRAATPSETDEWVTRQKAGTSNATLAQELLDSQAYIDHIRG
jgi:hypothetical protein